MKILLVGGGGREYAIAAAIKKNPRVSEMFFAPGNGGMSELGRCLPVSASDIEGIMEYARRIKPDFTIVASDDPLALGLVDSLEKENFRAFGPKKSAAALEWSKSFAKAFMKRNNIPTAESTVCKNYEEAAAEIEKRDPPYVLKADGLALGKGVVIAQTKEEALSAAAEMMLDKKFGNAGATLLIEEFMSGRECTILCFTDGETVIPMVSAQDHKRAFDNDEGPNTGGMGVVSPNPNLSDSTLAQAMEKIIYPTIKSMAAEDNPFSGVIYFELMLTKSGPKVIEYNARFGDPEAQCVLLRLKTDLLTIMESIADKKLADIRIEWDERAAATIVLASGGYPVKYASGYEITGLNDAAALKDVFVCHAGTKKSGEKFVTSGGRVLNVTALGATLEDALEKAYGACEKIHFTDMHFRKDIGRHHD